MSTTQEKLDKSRRFLLTVSCVLFFALAAGVEVDSVKLFGLDSGNLKNPNTVYWVAWAIWFYAIMRFRQLRNELGRDGSYDSNLDEEIARKYATAEVLTTYSTLITRAVAERVNEVMPSIAEESPSVFIEDGKLCIAITAGKDKAGLHFPLPHQVVESLRSRVRPEVRWNRASWAEYHLPFYVAAAPVIVSIIRILVAIKESNST